MERDKAILIISKRKLAELTREERGEILVDWWSINEKDYRFMLLPKSLQKELLSYDEPKENFVDSRYDLLILEALKAKYIGVKNEYISKKVSRILGCAIDVIGYTEELCVCPCCSYKTLDERGQYYICQVCFWEDDGNDDITKYSSPNHMTLAEGQLKFIKYGNENKKERYCKTK